MVNCGTLDRTMVFDNSDGFLGVTYDAFGKSTNVKHDPTNKKQFTGKEVDEDSGLQYFLARYYDPEVGRFLSKDPEQNLNLYVYCNNNPINLVDPDGREGMSKAQKDIYEMAVIIYCESTNGSDQMRAIGSVVKNRMASDPSNSSPVLAMAEKANPKTNYQNLDDYLNEGEGKADNYKALVQEKNKASKEKFAKAYAMATGIMNGDITDNTGGVKNFHHIDTGTSDKINDPKRKTKNDPKSLVPRKEYDFVPTREFPDKKRTLIVGSY